MESVHFVVDDEEFNVGMAPFAAVVKSSLLLLRSLVIVSKAGITFFLTVFCHVLRESLSSD